MATVNEYFKSALLSVGAYANLPAEKWGRSPISFQGLK